MTTIEAARPARKTIAPPPRTEATTTRAPPETKETDAQRTPIPREKSQEVRKLTQQGDVSARERTQRPETQALGALPTRGLERSPSSLSTDERCAKPEPTLPRQEFRNGKDKRDMNLQTRGNLYMKLGNEGLHPDAREYRLSWQPLGKDGRVRQSVSPPGGNSESHTVQVKGYPRPGHTAERIHKPPYENPDGWAVRVTFPPQRQYTRNPTGVRVQANGT
jgi:hypothetical protein